MTAWHDARHARKWGFHASTSPDEQAVCIATTDTQRFRALDESGQLGDFIDHQVPAIAHLERALLRLDLEFDTRFKALCEANGWQPSVLAILGRGSVRVTSSRAAAEAFSYHPLLGFAAAARRKHKEE